MEYDAHAPRALRAFALFTFLLLAAAACKADDTSASSNPVVEDDEEPVDAGEEIEDARVHADGAVQVRAQPEDGCEAVGLAHGSYFYCPGPMPYTDAVGACWAAGSTLVTINDADENQALVDEMVEDVYWIGFNDAREEEVWTWAAGSEGSDYVNWDDGEPRNADFVYIKRDNGRWATSTAIPMPYICEAWR